MFFTKTDSGGTDHVWFYDVAADGFSLDDKRTPLLDDSKLGSSPTEPPTPQELEKNNLPDVLGRWARRDDAERDRARAERSFCVARDEIVAEGYDLSINRYKEPVYEEVEHRPPADIIAELEQIEDEIRAGLEELKGLVV